VGGDRRVRRWLRLENSIPEGGSGIFSVAMCSLKSTPAYSAYICGSPDSMAHLSVYNIGDTARVRLSAFGQFEDRGGRADCGGDDIGGHRQRPRSFMQPTLIKEIRGSSLTVVSPT
jgi:hypothetical protein